MNTLKVSSKILVIALIAVSILSCSNALDKPYNKETQDADIQEIEKTLSAEDLEALNSYLSLSAKDSDMAGMTYEDIMAEAQKLKPALKEMKEKEAERAEKAKTDSEADLKSRNEERKRVEEILNAQQE